LQPERRVSDICIVSATWLYTSVVHQMKYF
jgi:hypothetical protein